MQMQTWPDGQPLTVFVLEDTNTLHRAFCREILIMLPFHLRRQWDRALFTGTGQLPIFVSNEEELKKRVSNTPGAIGYSKGGVIDESITVLRITK